MNILKIMNTLDKLHEWKAMPKTETSSVWSFDVIDSMFNEVATGYHRNSDGTFEMITDFTRTKAEALALGTALMNSLDGTELDASECDVIPAEIPVSKCTANTKATLKAMGLL